MFETLPWQSPAFIHLEKNVKYYRDLLRSTEKVELSLAHLGKKEVFDQCEATEPEDIECEERVLTVQVLFRDESDPRLSNLNKDGSVSYMSKRFTTPLTSPTSTASSSPSSITPDVLAALTLAKRQQLLNAAGKPLPILPRKRSPQDMF